MISASIAKSIADSARRHPNFEGLMELELKAIDAKVREQAEKGKYELFLSLDKIYKTPGINREFIEELIKRLNALGYSTTYKVESPTRIHNLKLEWN